MVEHKRHIAEQVFRQADLRPFQVQGDLVASGFFNAGLIQVTAQNTVHAGSDILVQPLAEGKHHVIGGKLPARIEKDPFSAVEDPGFQIIADLPVLQ